MIRRATSPIPIGRTPGHLSSAIRRQATNASRRDGSGTKVVQILLATKDNAWHRSVRRARFKSCTKTSPSYCIKTRWPCTSFFFYGCIPYQIFINSIKYDWCGSTLASALTKADGTGGLPGGYFFKRDSLTVSELSGRT